MKPFDKYYYYKRAVQSPEIDCQFLANAYKSLRGRPARVLREDFCGTFSVCCTWVRKSKDNRAVGIDLDPKPIAYGRKHYLPELNEAAQKRVNIVQGSVLSARVEKVDITAALNFSYYLFKTREELLAYFKRARAGLRPKGIFFVDCFGGSGCQESNVEETKHRGFRYYWEQVNFNPISYEAKFHIHFKRDGERKRQKVFSYDWRMWTIPEIREVMLEAGFKRTHVYWEGAGPRGKGDGIFRRREVGEDAEGWIAYVIGEI
ncbi:MAG TPA: class I SAM-dependent methyltransferase [Bdellovibrionales bacterium]|nr:class I SAM-dependent methyltransferase [Bdellovibrionales bacterium]